MWRGSRFTWYRRRYLFIVAVVYDSASALPHLWMRLEYSWSIFVTLLNLNRFSNVVVLKAFGMSPQISFTYIRRSRRVNYIKNNSGFITDNNSVCFIKYAIHSLKKGETDKTVCERILIGQVNSCKIVENSS